MPKVTQSISYHGQTTATNSKLAQILLSPYGDMGRKGHLKSEEEQGQATVLGVSMRLLLGTEQWSPPQP